MPARLHIDHATATRIGDVMAVVGEWAAVAALVAILAAILLPAAVTLGSLVFLYLLGASR